MLPIVGNRTHHVLTHKLHTEVATNSFHDVVNVRGWIPDLPSNLLTDSNQEVRPLNGVRQH
jgi:hypothetical protein